MEPVPVELSVKRLAFAIVQFLAEQNNIGNLSEDAKEGLEVATQCLERAFGLTADQESALSVSQSLLDIFHNATKNELPLEIEPEVKKEPELKKEPVSEADKAEAERLKTEGNDLMKAGRFLDAINCYTIQAYSSLKQYKESLEAYQKAVQLEPENESYRVNVKISEDNLKQSTPEMPQGPFGNLLSGAAPGGFDFGAILSNPNLVNMASEMMADPAMQSFMNNLVGGMISSTGVPNEGGAGLDSFLRAGQQVAAQMQNVNPDLVEQLRRQMVGKEEATILLE